MYNKQIFWQYFSSINNTNIAYLSKISSSDSPDFKLFKDLISINVTRFMGYLNVFFSAFNYNL